MSSFNYLDYQKAVEAAQANQANGNNTVKVGFMKLADDGDIAIARINIASTDELMFASVHQLNNVTINGNRWPKVSCLNPLGMGGQCLLCEMAKAQGSNVGKSAKKVYVPMLVSYRDVQSPTGFTAPAPVIWERPAGFARELANKLMVVGDLRNTLVMITRNGKKGDMQTTYSMDILPEAHPVFKPDLIPADFSAFANFNIAKHSYWEKTAEDIQMFANTGSFPEVARPASATTQAPVYANAASAVPAYVAPTNPVTENYAAAPTHTFVPGVAATPTVNPAPAASS